MFFPTQILSNDEFPAEVQALDDVAPHLGNSVDKKYPQGGLPAHSLLLALVCRSEPVGRVCFRCPGTVHVSMLQNPSHLEAVDPVVMGKVRAKQLRGGRAAVSPSTVNQALIPRPDFPHAVLARCHTVLVCIQWRPSASRLLGSA